MNGGTGRTAPGIRLVDAGDTERFGARIASLLRPGDIIALEGPLGAGKTTLARGMLRGLGYAGDVPSPTFTIVQYYDVPDVRVPVWHVDLYRVEDPTDIDELGLEEARLEGVLLIEWADRLTHRWPEMLVLSLRADAEGARDLTVRSPAAWEARWPPP